jgi:hypothetical protein
MDTAMPDTLRQELLRIVQAVTFPAPDTVALSGRTAPYAAMPGVLPVANPLVAQLQQLLYDACYCHRFDAARPEPKPATAGEPGFIETLSAANASHDMWDRGWQILQTLPSSQIVAGKGAITRMVWPGEFLGHGPPGLPPRPGTEISLFAAKESRTMQPGFYFAFGEALGDQEEETSLVRLYFHVKAAGAAHLLAAVTPALNRFAIPFRFKCLAMPELYERTDSAILYIAKRYYGIVAELLPAVHRSVRPFLEAATPLFSKRLADGLGLAENPRTGESFGMSRCRLVAEAVCTAHASGIDTAQGRLHEIAAAFAAAGVSLDHAHLNAGSADRYEFRESRAA